MGFLSFRIVLAIWFLVRSFGFLLRILFCVFSFDVFVVSFFCRFFTCGRTFEMPRNGPFVEGPGSVVCLGFGSDRSDG